MAIYRQVHITFWQDPFIEELKPMQKYFYLYLMTNSKTSQCGCYEISNKLIKYETGLTQEQIDDFLQLFQDERKIKFSKNTNEILILNWLKHNSYKSPKVKVCINKEIEKIKNKEFYDYINGIVNQGTSIDSLSIDYPKTIDTHLQKEQEQEQEEQELTEIKTVKKVYIDLPGIERIKLTQHDLDKLIEKYKDKVFIWKCMQSADNWLLAEGKTKKDYRAFLSNWIDKAVNMQN